MKFVDTIKNRCRKIKQVIINKKHSTVTNNINTDELKPLVFVNRPIKKVEEDVVGFSTQVDTICEAMESGSTMIGVVADYGTGKSSITDLLINRVKSKPYKYPKPIKVNLWDCLQNEKSPEISNKAAEREVSDLTKSFLYQLASGHDKKHRFSSYINKRLSRNYGNISFSTGSFKFWWKFAVAALFYAIYAVCSNDNVRFGKVIPQGWFLNVLHYCQAFSPVFLVIATLFIVWGVINTCVVFSHWRMQNARETEINDVFDVYSHIIEHIKPKRKKRQIIIIEDLDRIVEKTIIIGFLKELYRFQSSMQDDSNRFVFIVSIKPEICLQDQKTQLVVDDKNIYSKVFDVVIPLKPIHYDDYDAILLALINSDPKNKSRLEKLIGKTISKDVLPESFYWIKKGKNLTLRDLKDRLNHAIMILISRKSYIVRSSADFNACAAVTYLESEYPKCYQTLTQDEEAFARLMSRSVVIINQNKSGDALNSLKEELNKQFPNQEEPKWHVFSNDLCQLICDGVFNYDFRMYFYTYPSGSHIKTTEERQICDMLLFPARFNDYKEIDRITDMVYADGDSNIVTNTIKSLENYPQVILMNKTLLRVSCELNLSKVASTVNAVIIEPMALDEFAIDFWKRVHDIDFDAKPEFIDKLVEYLNADFSSPEDTALTRKYIVTAYKKDIAAFKKIFYKENNPHIPLITEEETELIEDTDTLIDLIDADNLSRESFSYISNLLCKEKLIGDSFDKALTLFKKYAELKPEGFERALLLFMHINQYQDDDLFHLVCNNPDKSLIPEYINDLDSRSLSDKYVDEIEKMAIEDGLSQDVLEQLASHRRYRCLLLRSAKYLDYRLLDPLLDDSDRIIEDCAAIRNDYPDSLLKLRWHLCIEKYDERFFELFLYPFVLIGENEYVSLDDTSSAISCINIDSIDEENCSSVLKLIAKRTYDKPQTVLLVKQLFDPEQYSDNIVTNESLYQNFVCGIDWKVIDIKKLPIEDRETVFALIQPGFDYAGITLEDQLKRLGCLVPSAEKILCEEDSHSYQNIVQEFDEFTPFTLEWMAENYIEVALSEQLSNILKENKDYENYITSTALRRNDMVLDDSIDFERYLNVYLNVSEMYSIMSNHWIFLEGLQKGDYLKKLFDSDRSEELIPPIYKVNQHKEFFSFILSDRFDSNKKIEYLDSIGKLAAEQDSKDFQELICKPENMELMGDKDRYWRIWHNFWKTSHKSLFTRKWNERWASEIDIMS